MICDFCGREGARIHFTTESLGKGDNLLVIEEVPVVTCPHCGQSYLTAETVHQIEKIRRNRRKLVKRLVDVAAYVAAV